MVNQVILDYLSRYSGMYKLEDLKNKIIATGYSPQEVDEASGVLGLEGGVEKNDLQFQALEEKFAVKTFKWMKFGGIIGIIFGLLLSYSSALIGRQILGSELIKADVGFGLILAALLFSIIIVLMAGIIPALQASRKNPVDALRFIK